MVLIFFQYSVETVATLKQHYVLVPSHVREPYLYHLLCNPPESIASLRRVTPEPIKPGKTRGKTRTSQKPGPDEDIPIQPPPTIIFCTKPRTAAYITHLLQTLSIRSTALHSRLTQRERLTSLSLFRSSFIPVLVSTDVGARGLDIEDVAMVINWDLPNEPEEYTHRVGRTARAGKGGVAISFVTEKDEERVSRIEARIGTLFYPWYAVIELAHNFLRDAIRGYDHARKRGFRKIEYRIHSEKTSKYGAHVKR